MPKSSLQRAGETAGLGMMPAQTQDEKLLQADAFKMRGAAMGQERGRRQGTDKGADCRSGTEVRGAGGDRKG